MPSIITKYREGEGKKEKWWRTKGREERGREESTQSHNRTYLRYCKNESINDDPGIFSGVVCFYLRARKFLKPGSESANAQAGKGAVSLLSF